MSFKNKKKMSLESLENRRVLSGDGIAPIADATDGLEADVSEAIVGDIDGDGHCGFEDFLILAKNMGRDGATPDMGDLDGDGSVGFPDFLKLAKNFNRGRSADAPRGRPADVPRGPKADVDEATTDVDVVDSDPADGENVDEGEVEVSNGRPDDVPRGPKGDRTTGRPAHVPRGPKVDGIDSEADDQIAEDEDVADEVVDDGSDSITEAAVEETAKDSGEVRENEEVEEEDGLEDEDVDDDGRPEDVPRGPKGDRSTGRPDDVPRGPKSR